MNICNPIAAIASTSTSSPPPRPSHHDVFDDRSISPFDFIGIIFMTVSAVTMTMTILFLFLLLFLLLLAATHSIHIMSTE